MRDDITHYQHLFFNDIPLLDVRAPVEFQKGAFPGVVNLPLLTDAERHQVGICYKRQGQSAAIALGHRMVRHDTKAQRVAGWAAFAAAYPTGYVYCFRGGQRSLIAQQWLQEAGVSYPRVVGGYKAMRQFLLQELEQAAQECRLIVLGGMTGTGKTEVLHGLRNAIDLESHAHHRGSSFGKHAQGQPVQIDFENRLAIDILKKRLAGRHCLVLEDESRTIGRCNLPISLYQAMQQAPMVWLEDSFDFRVQRILRDYVTDLCAEFVALHGAEQGFGLFARHLRQSLDNITRRLGAERHRRLAGNMDAALTRQAASGSVDAHCAWIAGLLNEYYDPMYIYQREIKASRIIFEGDRHQVLGALREGVVPVTGP